MTRLPTTVTVAPDGQLTVPTEIARRCGMVPGLAIVIAEAEGQVVLTATDPDQAWFWTPEWQEGEREAEEDIAAGRVSRWYSDAAELIADLKQGACTD